jgi:S-adenosylmethionine:tRNA ribosyltransferase-isomerase
VTRPALRTDDFDFELPDEAIALRPARPRDAARLLVVRPGRALEDRVVRDLPDLLAPGDLLVLNDTRVLAARLDGLRRRDDGAIAQIEATLIERLAPDRWLALARPGKRLKAGDRVEFAASRPPPVRGEDSRAEGAAGGGHPIEGGTSIDGPHPAGFAAGPSPWQGRDIAASVDALPASPACLLGSLAATVAEKRDDGSVVFAFDLAGPDLDDAIARIGRMPLPPYIAGRRAEDAADRDDYQTVFAREPGAVAAPTAGLHLTPALLDRLAERGVGHVFVTLHVGAGTFLPVKSETVEGHRMHAERGSVSGAAAARINAARAAGGRVVAVGTTALRILESAAGEDGSVRPFQGATDIFITPGYRFRAVDLLMTNFHLPRSTLFMLVAAFSGLDEMKRAYAHALAAGYRFYSYGDASLLFPDRP